MAKADESNLYLDRFLMTLEINKIEAKYQEALKPPVFIKEYDETGLVKNFRINSCYQDRVPVPRREFTEEEYEKILEEFDPKNIEFMQHVEIMLQTSCIEDKLREKTAENTAPIFLKKFNKLGVMVEIEVNPLYEKEFKEMLREYIR